MPGIEVRRFAASSARACSFRSSFKASIRSLRDCHSARISAMSLKMRTERSAGGSARNGSISRSRTSRPVERYIHAQAGSPGAGSRASFEQRPDENGRGVGSVGQAGPGSSTRRTACLVALQLRLYPLRRCHHSFAHARKAGRTQETSAVHHAPWLQRDDRLLRR